MFESLSSKLRPVPKSVRLRISKSFFSQPQILAFSKVSALALLAILSGVFISSRMQEAGVGFLAAFCGVMVGLLILLILSEALRIVQVRQGQNRFPSIASQLMFKRARASQSKISLRDQRNNNNNAQQHISVPLMSAKSTSSAAIQPQARARVNSAATSKN